MEAQQKQSDAEWSDKQKKAFIEIQNRIYSEMDLSNEEVAEMHSLVNKESVFSIFQFMTSRWISEFAEQERLKKRSLKQVN